MSQAHPPRAVIDSDIIFSRVLHELIGRVAKQMRLLDLVWSYELLTEAKRTLMQRKGLAEDVAQRWVDYLTGSFPDGETDITQVMSSAELSSLSDDPDDHHVCALAITSDSQYLFTHDRGYLSAPLAARGIEVIDPHMFLTAALQDQPQAMLDLLEQQARTWAGGRPITELLNALHRAGAAALACHARRLIDGQMEPPIGT